MKIEIGKKYKAAGGLEYEIIGKFSSISAGVYPYLGIARNGNGELISECNYNEDGKSRFGFMYDLLPPTIKHTRYVHWLRAPAGHIWTQVATERHPQAVFGSELLRVDELYFEEQVK